MKVSIITATLNNADTLGRTIESVASQSHPELELVVVDGGSTDGSVDLLRSCDERFPNLMVWCTEPDSGVYAALNKGIRMATGDVVGVLHGNDYLVNTQVVARVVEALKADPATPYIYGDVHYFSAAGRCVRLYSGPERLAAALRRGIAPPHPGLYLRTEVLRRVGLYREDYRVAADYELFVRLALVHGLIGTYLPMDMVAMSLGGLSTRLANRLLTNNLEKMRALRENGVSRTGLGVLRRYFYNPLQ